MTNCNMWRYITFKAGQNRDRVRNSGQFSVLNDLVIFPGQAVKIWDCPKKIGMGGHLIINIMIISRFWNSSWPNSVEWEVSKKSRTLLVNTTLSSFLVLLLGDPHLLERALQHQQPDNSVYNMSVSEQSLTPHPTQYRSFRRRSSQPITWLTLTNKAVQENKHKSN